MIITKTVNRQFNFNKNNSSFGFEAAFFFI